MIWSDVGCTLTVIGGLGFIIGGASQVLPALEAYMARKTEDANEYGQAVLPLQEEKFEGYLTRAREAAVRLAQEKGQITIDDVWEACPPPRDLDPRVLGGVFRRSSPAGEFVIVGYQKSRRTKFNHGRAIAVWKLVEEAA